MTDIDTQLRDVFRQLGMEPNEIRYNENLDNYEVSVKAEGSDERYLRPIEEIGGTGPIEYQLNFSAVREAVPAIDGTNISAGKISVVKIDSEYIWITIE